MFSAIRRHASSFIMSGGIKLMPATEQRVMTKLLQGVLGLEHQVKSGREGGVISCAWSVTENGRQFSIAQAEAIAVEAARYRTEYDYLKKHGPLADLIND